MKRLFMVLLAAALCCGSAKADEGMWLVHLLGKIHPEMRAKGLKLKAGEIFDTEHPSLCDAVVAVDGGMGTGSMISDRGLMITNHHVAYSDICALSTPEHNILEDGFWARNTSEELPVKGKTVMFLREVTDITAEATALRDSMKAVGKWNVMGSRRLAADIEKRHERQGFEAACVSMWGGEMYLLFYYEVYRDVRLVGAPPVRIGAFGGETDNWGWPQHKGDFALYRVYGDSQGHPADYDPENRPIKPRKVLKISTRGVKDGDFAMVIGFPGRTRRYGSPYAVDEKQTMKNPIIEKCRHERMEIIRRHMESDSLVRMAYSDSYFNLSNYADYARWENICLRRYNVKAHRRKEAADIFGRISADAGLQSEYGNLADDLERAYAARRDAATTLTWYQESWLGPTRTLIVANRLASSLQRTAREGVDTVRVGSKEWTTAQASLSMLESNYDADTERDLFIRCAGNFLREVPRNMWGSSLAETYDSFGGDAERLLADSFDRSFCRTADTYREFFSVDRSVAEVLADPLVAMTASVGVQPFTQAVRTAELAAGVSADDAEAAYRKAQYRLREADGKAQYPDANSTMRLTYGTVCSLNPADGVHYDSRSTTAGYPEKYDAENYDFRPDGRIEELAAARDWGRWGERGEMYVNFLTNNDITGGNSGSPVLNGRGELTGLAFDGNRESMAGDLWFHPELARTVNVDIRYVMWLIEKYAGAGYLLDEMTFAK